MTMMIFDIDKPFKALQRPQPSLVGLSSAVLAHGTALLVEKVLTPPRQ